MFTVQKYIQALKLIIFFNNSSVYNKRTDQKMGYFPVLNSIPEDRRMT